MTYRKTKSARRFHVILQSSKGHKYDFFRPCSESIRQELSAHYFVAFSTSPCFLVSEDHFQCFEMHTDQVRFPAQPTVKALGFRASRPRCILRYLFCSTSPRSWTRLLIKQAGGPGRFHDGPAVQSTLRSLCSNVAMRKWTVIVKSADQLDWSVKRIVPGM